MCSEGNEPKTVKYNISEREQWSRSTLGYAKAFSRQYASEVRVDFVLPCNTRERCRHQQFRCNQLISCYLPILNESLLSKNLELIYCVQILPHMELLDAEIFNGDVHPLFLKAVYDGLSRT